MIYDYQPGDIIQYKSYYHSSYGYYSSVEYTKYTYLERNETSDSLKYLVKRESFEEGATTANTVIFIQSFYKHDFVASIPFDFPAYEDVYFYSNFSLKDYCGLELWTQEYSSTFDLVPCDDDFWCYIGETITWWDNIFVAGLGAYHISSSDPRPEGSSSGNYIIYFKKGSTECGEEVIVGLPDVLFAEESLLIYPNPANNSFLIRSDNTEEYDLEILDLKGIKIHEVKHFRTNKEVDIRNLPAGVYLVRLVNDTGTNTGKLIIK